VASALQRARAQTCVDADIGRRGLLAPEEYELQRAKVLDQ
jgi:hypothetical protein